MEAAMTRLRQTDPSLAAHDPRARWLVSSLACREYRRNKGENQPQVVVACARRSTRSRECAGVTDGGVIKNIAEAFHVKGGLDEVDFGEECDCAPIQPVVWIANVCVVCSGKTQCKAHLDRGPGLAMPSRGCVYSVDSSFMLIQRRIHGHEPHHC